MMNHIKLTTKKAKFPHFSHKIRDIEVQIVGKKCRKHFVN